MFVKLLEFLISILKFYTFFSNDYKFIIKMLNLSSRRAAAVLFSQYLNKMFNSQGNQSHKIFNFDFNIQLQIYKTGFRTNKMGLI